MFGVAEQAKRRISAYWRQRNYPAPCDRRGRFKRNLVRQLSRMRHLFTAMEIYGSLVLLARHCPTIENRCLSRQAGRMILVAKRHRFTAMEIYGSVVLLARHCPNIENRCFARQAGGEGGIR